MRIETPMQTLSQISESYLKWAPLSLSIREVTRINALRLLDQQYGTLSAGKILDVGCGDGRWWTYLLPHDLKKVHGIDISRNEVQAAQASITAQTADVASDSFQLKMGSGKYDLVIGNCSLEHVFEINKALSNIREVMADNGTFILFVPTPYWALKGKSIGYLHSISPRLSMSFSGLINGFFQHWHLYSHSIWRSLLVNTGFKIKSIHGLGNSRSEFLFRLGLPSAFLAFLVKAMTGRYANYFLKFLVPVSVWQKMAQMISSSVEERLLSPDDEHIFEYMIVCTK